MTTVQKIIKWCAIALAICLIAGIVASILGLLGIIGGVSMLGGLAKDAAPVDASFGPFAAEVTVLDMQIGAADIRIETGESLMVWTDNPYISVEQKQGKLVIREKSHVAHLSGSELVLTIPAGYVFEQVDMETGAGRISAEELRCRDLDLELGAGKAELDLLEVTDRADIDGGAGEMEIHSGAIRSLDFDMGVGQARITAALTGQTDVAAGVGALYMTVLGSGMEDYTISVEQGIGQVRIGGTAYTGDALIGSGPERMNIEGGIGSVDITFEEPAA